MHPWQDFNTKDCDYTPDEVLYLVILPQILAKICLSSTTCIDWCELVWKGAKPDAKQHWADRTWESQNVSSSLPSRILSSVHMMPTSLGPLKEHLCSWYTAEMVLLYHTAHKKANTLCKLMPNQAPYDISLSISKKTDCEPTDSMCLLNYFDGLEASKCSKKEEECILRKMSRLLISWLLLQQ